jgi:hypothetical protein
MATIATALETEFTPAAGDFIVQATGRPVSLVRKNTSGAAFASVAAIDNQALIVSNPIAGAVYKFVATGLPAVVQADQ